MKHVFAVVACVVVLGIVGCKTGGKTVATIGSQSISVEAYQERLSQTPAAFRSFLATEAGKKQFVDLLVREKLVAEAARKAGIDRNADYKNALNQFKKDQKRKYTEYRDNLLVEMYISKLRQDELKVTNEDVTAYYTEHKKDFTAPVEVTAQHILLATKEDAQKALDLVKKQKKDFGQVAKDMSTDVVSASRGGKIGPFKRGDVLPEFEKVVFSLKNGQISDIVKTQFGYHVIKKLSSKKLPAVEEKVALQKVQQVLEKEKFDAWLEKKKKELAVSIDYETIASISTAAPEQETAPTKPAEEK